MKALVDIYIYHIIRAQTTINRCLVPFMPLCGDMVAVARVVYL